MCNCATSLVKYFLLFFNFLCVLGGAAFIALGVLQYKGYHEYADKIEGLGLYKISPLVLMTIGGVTLIIALIGCCGTIKENRSLMMAYAWILAILLIVEVAFAVGLYYYQDELKSILKTGLERSLQQNAAQEFWDTIQRNLKCCGVESSNDWLNLQKPIPDSCCDSGSNCSAKLNLNLGKLMTNSDSAYPDGCLDKILSELKTEYGKYICITIGTIQFLGLIFACCLGKKFRENYNYIRARQVSGRGY